MFFITTQDKGKDIWLLNISKNLVEELEIN